MQPLLFSSLFSWSFVGASLLMCIAMLNQYEQNWSLTIREVLGGSLIAALTFSSIVSLIGRRHVFSKALTEMTRDPGSLSRITTIYSEVSRRMGLSHVSLREARLARLAFRFDPLLRLVEAAIHRERELWADRVAIMFTGKPLALASALVKANAQPKLGASVLTAGLFLGSGGKGLFSFYPNLERRVDALLELAKKMEVAQAIA